MTEEERRQQNWVALRASCTRQGVFDQLVDVIKCDVKRFNDLDPEMRPSGTFGHSRKDRGTFGVGLSADDQVRYGEGNDYVWLKLTATAIEVYRKNKLLFEVEQCWNGQTLACNLLVQGQRHSIWQISQRAIGDLLFAHQS